MKNATDSTKQVETEESTVPPRAIELGLSLFFLGVTMLAFIATWEFPGTLDDRDPGPAVLPRYLSLTGMVVSAVLLAHTLRRRGGWAVPRPGRPIVVFGWTVLCLVLEPMLGYVITMAAFMFGITQILRVGNRWVAGAFSILATLGTHSLFADVLGIPL